MIDTKNKSSGFSMKRVLITGSNSGIGFSTARWVSEISGVEEIILAVRSQSKGDEAIERLVKQTGRSASLFSVLLIDVGDLDSAMQAATNVEGPIDGMVLNAGGMMGKDTRTKAGVLTMFQVNTLGHSVFVDAMIKQGKLSTGAHIVWSGSEATRGLPMMGFGFPGYAEKTSECVDGYITGTAFQKRKDDVTYAYAKSIMTLYVSALARRHPEYVISSVSPGATIGTDVAANAPWFMRFAFKYIGPCCGVPLGMMHSVDVAAQRYIHGLTANVTSGCFLASPKGKASGKLQDQYRLYPVLADEVLQEAAYEAVRKHF